MSRRAGWETITYRVLNFGRLYDRIRMRIGGTKR
jgi:hypothetical protein